jgi:RNA recognition motif-containing protein
VNHAFHLTARLPSVEIVTKQPSLPASKPAAFASPLTPLSSSLHPSRFGQVSSQALVVVTTAAIVKLFSRAPSHPTPIFIAPLQSATVLHRRPARPHDPTFLCHTLQPSNDNLIKMAAVVDKVAGATAEIVSEVAAAISNITVNDPKEGAAADGSRLYIGNLAYATTEEQLKEVFSSYSVESVTIPKNPRNDRPVGYAFVDLATPAEAERAIAELSGQEILERKVSVQLARAPATPAEKADRADYDGRRRPSNRGRGGARGRGRFSRGPRNGSDHETTGEHADHEPKALGDITNKKPAERGPREDKPHVQGQGQGQFRRERGPPSDGIPSKTKVMVANLPYDLTEDKLKELFASYQPTACKIALRPIPRFVIEKLQARGEPRKGRGFGFVTLGSEELQKKAVAEMNGIQIDGRDIAVKIAIDSPDKVDSDAAGQVKGASGVVAAPAEAAHEEATA